MEITKASGEKVPFDKDKLCRSLKAAGAPEALVNETCEIIAGKLLPGATTTEIWRRALRYLVKKNITAAARYNLRRGMATLGPAGFLFEQFLEALLKTNGFETARNQMLRGKCVSHEVDVTASQGGTCFLIEAKYHNDFGTKVATDVVMYADARREDISRGGKPCSMWVITNTKFTGNAIEYAKCRGLKLTGWHYPQGGESLESLIVAHALYPVTVLPSVDRFAREQFAKANMMLAQDVAPYTPEALETHFGIPIKHGKKIVSEAQALVSGEAGNVAH